ncbi:MAG: hypothetical protein JST82_01425 [Bacteroidetes bacterium]|nr:hypothetical protein [Bacteroidota bacterium]
MRKIFFMAFALLSALTVMAQAPQKFNYQGIARNTSGTPLASQALGIRLTVHDATATGAILYQETFNITTNAYGLYTLQVGGGTVVSGTFNTISWGSGAKYLQVEIDPAGGTSYADMGSNQLISVPYAVYANNAGAIQGNNVSTTAPAAGQILVWDAGTSTWLPQNAAITAASGTNNQVAKFTGTNTLGSSNITDNGTSVGISTTSPNAMTKLHVSGVGTYNIAPYYQAGIVADGTSTASASGIYATGGWRGVFGHNLGTYVGSEAMGIYGRQEGSSYTTTGYGVKGENTGTGGTANYGVYGTASAASGIGVAGVVSGATAIAGKFDGGTAGGYGIIVNNGMSGFGTTAPGAWVHIKNSKDANATVGAITFGHTALLAQTSSTTTSTLARGIVGAAGNSSSENHGLFGYAANPGGSSYNVAGFFYTAGSTSTGNSYGLYSTATNGAVNYGIYAGASGTGYAGYFAGNVTVTGTLAKGGGTFKIDHPLDPENKYLYHSFVESPDMMNIYNGNIVTDAAGNATVTLPSYFEALNQDFRYQLTVMGSFAQAIIAEEVSGNQFKIKTDKPNVKVSWQVTGVRHDKFANAHRVVPETEKEPEMKGHYLHAAEWGMPESKSAEVVNRPPSANELNKPQGTK